MWNRGGTEALLLLRLMQAATGAACESYALGQLSTGITPTATTRTGLVDAILAAVGQVSKTIGIGPATVLAGGLNAGWIAAYEFGRSALVGLPQIIVTTGLPDDTLLITHRLAIQVIATEPQVLQADRPSQAGVDVAAYQHVGATRLHDDSLKLLTLTLAARLIPPDRRSWRSGGAMGRGCRHRGWAAPPARCGDGSPSPHLAR